jgi:hypothetical protein
MPYNEDWLQDLSIKYEDRKLQGFAFNRAVIWTKETL